MARATTAKFVIKLENRTKRAFKAIGRSLKRTTSAIFSMRAGFIAAAGIAGIGYFVKKSMDATDEMAKMSRAIGVSVENLQRLRHAAALGGMKTTQLDKAVQKLAINLADVAGGTGEALDEFKAFNIAAVNADGSMRNVLDVLADVADVTQKLGDTTERTNLMYKLFGARGAKMVNILKDGSEAMRETMLEAGKLGLVMSAETAKGVEDANDAITRLSSFLGSSFTQTVARLAPLIEQITNGIREWVEMKISDSGGIGMVARQMANAIIHATIVMLEAFDNLGNGVIDFVQKIKDVVPGGVRSIEAIEKSILKAQRAIKDKHDPNMRGAFSLFSFETLEAELKSFTDELEVAIATQSDFRFNSIELQKALANLIRPYVAVTEAVKKMGEESGKSVIPDGQLTIWDQMTEGFEKYKATVEKGTLSIASITGKMMQGTEDAIVNMLMGVKTDFRSLAKSILADLIRIQVRKNIILPLGNMDWKNILGFAQGGRPTVGRPSIVGERGAELFVPDRAGTIIPNNKLSMSGDTNINVSFNITANDTDGFDELLESRRGMIVNLINSAMNDRGALGVT